MPQNRCASAPGAGVTKGLPQALGSGKQAVADLIQAACPPGRAAVETCAPIHTDLAPLPDPQPKPEKSAAQARLASALRENLKRRKAQSRGRAIEQPPAPGAAPEDPPGEAG